MTVELTITLPDFDNPKTAAHYLNKALRALRKEHTGDGMINVSFPGLLHQHDNWEWGQPCPECETDNLCVGELTYSEQYATGEHIEPGQPLDFDGGVLSVSCNNHDCLTDLYVTPASYLAEH